MPKHDFIRCAAAATVTAMLFVAASAASGGDRSAATQRAQQSDTFQLELQQSTQRFRAGNLSPADRAEFEALQHNQRLRHSEQLYRQDVQRRASPGSADALRLEQERAMQRDRDAREAEDALARPRPAIPNPQPAP